MTEVLKFVPPRVRMVDPQSGIITREWYLFFQGVFNRIGGADGPNMFDLVQAQPEDAGLEELKALVYALRDAWDQLPTAVQPPADDVVDPIAELREQVAELTKAVEALQQGVSI